MLIIVLLGQIISSTEAGNVLITNIARIENTGEFNKTTTKTNYNHIIRYYCQIYGIDAELVKLVIEKESNFNPNAVSTSGAIGLMQLMPETAEQLGVSDIYDPWQNIKGGVKFLRQLFDMFGGDLELVLAAYHAGPGLVKSLNRVPAIPATIDYVDYIIARYGPARKKIPIYFSLSEDGTPFFTNLPK
jgi:soluble lytic murein transglycosylase-like protein